MYKMQLMDKYRKEFYEAPLLSIIELEYGIDLCQTSIDTGGSLTIDPGFEGEITIILG